MPSKYFPEVPNIIPFEGRDSRNPLAFKFYDKKRLVGDKTMGEHLRFSVAYWHTFMGSGSDMFGSPSVSREWHKSNDSLDRATETMEAAFEFFQKLGIEYYCFHDRDIAPEGESFVQSCKNLETLVGQARNLQNATGIKLLWGTANLFSNPIYAQGAATNPDAHIMALAAAQVKHAIDATHQLEGENYVFWGGREGYETLLNTDLKREQDQLARFLHMAVEYKRKIGFGGQFLIEPKPAEPTKHQYDFDAATTLSFLQQYGLLDHFKLNVEANHATLAGHSFEHELAVASVAGKLGSGLPKQGCSRSVRSLFRQSHPDATPPGPEEAVPGHDHRTRGFCRNTIGGMVGCLSWMSPLQACGRVGRGILQHRAGNISCPCPLDGRMARHQSRS